jgi:uncharacterized protein
MDKQKKIIDQTILFTKEQLKDTEAGHDWWHTYRVWKMSKYIASKEDCNSFIVEMGALLHDIADQKFHQGNEEIGPQTALKFLKQFDLNSSEQQAIINIIKHISFKGLKHKQDYHSPELSVVQDADRLDALGAIGVARAFHYGGYKNRAMYNPNIQPEINQNATTYKKRESPTINHFYEKLIHLKDLMNTDTGREIAQERHDLTIKFLQSFLNEWNFNETD